MEKSNKVWRYGTNLNRSIPANTEKLSTLRLVDVAYMGFE
jgi:hypothetical protein